MVQDETTIPLWKEKSQEDDSYEDDSADNYIENEWEDNSTEDLENQSRWQKLADRLINDWQ